MKFVELFYAGVWVRVSQLMSGETWAGQGSARAKHIKINNHKTNRKRVAKHIKHEQQ